MLFRVACWSVLSLAVCVAGAGSAHAEPPAGLTISPSRLMLSSPEFRASVSLRNDSDRVVKLKLSADAWAQSDDGKAMLTPSADLSFEPATVSVPAGETARVTVTVTVRPRGVEAAYQLFAEEEGTPAAPAARTGVPVFVHYGRPIGVPFVEALTVTNGEIEMVVRNVGGGYMSVPTVRIRGVGANGRDVFERTAEGTDLLAQRRLVLRIPLEGEQCGQSRQLVVTVVTSVGAPISILNLQPTACPAKAMSSGK